MFRPLHSTLLLSLLVAFSQAKTNDKSDGKDPGLQRYVSRPDIRSPKWNFTMYNESLNSPGYWFQGIFKNLGEDDSDESWVGPCIYNGSDGELIWSGGLMFHNNPHDFRISNVNGEDLMTVIINQEAVVMNNNYTIRSRHTPQPEHFPLNGHEFNFVDNGTRALVIENNKVTCTREESKKVGFDGECIAKFQGFAEMDVTQEGWPFSFQWNSYGHIGLDEATLTDRKIENLCKGWDNVHGNSVDKTSTGDYLYSARHADALWKISGQDGSIIWRLGGTKSDFDIPSDLVFSRQHDVRFRGQNDTHLLLSFMDNTKGQDSQPATHDFARAQLFAVDETAMTVTLEASYPHPHRQHVPRRGNYQPMPNGNVFVGWSERALQSEHTRDGELIWEAILEVDWMGSYRNYKFGGFVGEPLEDPTAVAVVHGDTGALTTLVHVSWNGATEVAGWEVYGTAADGGERELLASAPKQGFETAVRFEGYARHVVVDAVDKDGERIGQSAVVLSAGEDGYVVPQQEEEEEEAVSAPHTGFGMLALAFAMGTLFGMGVLLGVWFARGGAGLRERGEKFVGGLFGRARGFAPDHRYAPVGDEMGEEDAMPLRAGERKGMRDSDSGD